MAVAVWYWTGDACPFISDKQQDWRVIHVDLQLRDNNACDEMQRFQILQHKKDMTTNAPCLFLPHCLFR